MAQATEARARAAASDHLEWLARLGYAARGTIYVIVGGLAVAAAIGGGGRTTDSEGALREILSQPFGDVLLGVVALGLVGFAAWRVVQAIKDTDGHGSDAKGAAIRGGLLASAATHAALAVFAASLIFGWGTGGGGSSAQDWTAKLLSQPFGQWLVGLVGLAIAGGGVAQIIKGYRQKFRRYLDLDDGRLRRFAPICRFGLVARGVVFIIIGGFFVVAAIQAEPGEARGLDGALRALQQQPYGWLLLGVVALGLVAFGVYGFVEAAYRRINPRLG